MKREHGGDDDRGRNHSKRQKSDGFSDALAQGKFELRMLLSSKAAGAVIGKGGENIKRLRKDFDGQISVPDSTTPERILTVVAPSDVIISIIEDIMPRLDDGQSTNERDKAEVRMLVHQSHAGALIGRQGSKIKDLRERSNSKIKVFQTVCPMSTDRIVLISGEQQPIVDAVRIIIDELKEIPIKGPCNPYSSNNYDPQITSEYGGYAPPAGSSFGPPQRYGGGGGGGGGGRGYSGGGRGGSGPSRSGSGGGGGYGYGYGGSMEMGGMGYGHMGGGYGAPAMAYGGYGGNGGQVTTTQVTIPTELGGTIIGRGGERINRIRDESRANITLEAPVAGQEERIITISGTPAQIQNAQYLLQQCVRSSLSGRKYDPRH